MEFLMTYGWAILIMLVVIAVLFYLGIFNPAPPESCTLPNGFTCYEFDIGAGGNIYLDIGQANGRTINITGWACNNTGTNILVWQWLSGANPVWNASLSIANGRHDVLLNNTAGGRNYNLTSCCPSSSGSACKARIAFNYSMAGSGLTRTAYGDIGGSVP